MIAKQYPSEFSSRHSYREAMRQRQRREENKAFCETLKTQCAVTKLSFPPDQLEFHHLKKPNFRISSRYHLSRNALLKEISNCIIVHRDIHRAIHKAEIEFLRAFRSGWRP